MRSLLALFTFGKRVMTMYVVDATSLYFGLITGIAIYKTYIFGDDSLVVTSSTLLYFGLLKFFILSSNLIAVKFIGFFQRIDHKEQNPTDVLIKCETIFQILAPINSPILYYQQYGNDVATVFLSSIPGLACDKSWCVPVHGKGGLHRYKSYCC